ncbi:CRISPR-associated endonuclease Cas6 [Cecembia calidifontis]|uniref:Uncharacterized protein n=1 Tax=Cecembia calidifontis TaxID=1187080 RepID=A0A4Q7PBS5_9BACT|nr:CRISPR-associated endonuclease Cas6 [Cecembia calidifontis]RZS97148.1 hypothetical protein BC751_2745 [Cecembia calidifontis]
MPKIKVLKIVFDTELKDYEIPAFRGAIIDLVGREHVIFHNHLSDDRFHYKYPVIQYKRDGKRASLVCIKEGVEEIHAFFHKNEGVIRIGSDFKSLYVDQVKLNSYQLEILDNPLSYSIYKWLPINSANFPKFIALESLAEQLGFLEKTMIGNILSMAKGLDWQIDKTVTVNITRINRQYWTKLKGQKVLSFDLEFKTNVFLPYDIGLGKSSSLGYGTIGKVITKKSVI